MRNLNSKAPASPPLPTLEIMHDVVIVDRKRYKITLVNLSYDESSPELAQQSCIVTVNLPNSPKTFPPKTLTMIMNRTQEMTCKAVDLDGDGSAANNAWLDQHTAPMDVEEDTGAHPYQAAALRAYLEGDSNACETAAAMTKPHGSEKKTDLRDRVLGIIEDALFAARKPHARPRQLAQGTWPATRRRGR